MSTYSGRNDAGVVARVAERHLRQVVRAEGEELRHFAELVGDQRRARDLDHRADDHRHLDAALRDHLGGDAPDHLLQ